MRRLIPPAVALTLTACAAAFPSAPPVGKLQPAAANDVDGWVASLRQTMHTTLRFNWMLNQDEGKGKGVVGIAPRDSLFLDYHAQLGAHPGSAFVQGDTAVWAEPKEDVEKLVPSYDLLWGLVGVARPSRTGWKVDGGKDAVRTTWRYTRGADTTEYVLWKADGILSLQTTVTVDGKRVGRVVTVFDASRHPVKSRLDAYANRARLDLAFYAGTSLPFDRDMWLAPRP
jgi:hypothetical protein